MGCAGTEGLHVARAEHAGFPHTPPVQQEPEKNMVKSSEAGVKPLCVYGGLHGQGLASCTLQRKCSESLGWA